MTNCLLRRCATGAASLVIVATFGAGMSTAPVAGAATDPATLSGEGSSFLQPVVGKLLYDSSSNLSGLFGAFVANGLDQGIKDFVGSAPDTFGADFAVTERPLTSTEAATAKANGRSFVYVPIAATPVAVATLVPTTAYSGGGTITSAQLCPHIKMTIGVLASVFGFNSANPVNGWNDSRFSCTTGLPLTGPAPVLAANADPNIANFALMTLLNSEPTAQSFFRAGLQSAFNLHSASTANTAPNTTWPYTGKYNTAGGDNPFVGKLLSINATTNTPNTAAAAWALGATFPISSVWTGTPLGAPWNIPTASLANAQGSFVAPSATSSAAAEASTTLAATSDPTTNNLVTFNPAPTDATAYNNYLTTESYLVVPTNGLPAGKAKALANVVRYFLGPAGARIIRSFGAAPATTAMATAGLAAAAQLDTEAAQAAATTSSSTTTTTVAGTNTTASTSGTNSGPDTGSASGIGTTGASTSAGLAFTGSPDLVPIVGGGIFLLVAGELVRRRMRRRPVRP
jgi:ABC-type phosphate transport system substrate-binding protein